MQSTQQHRRRTLIVNQKAQTRMILAVSFWPMLVLAVATTGAAILCDRVAVEAAALQGQLASLNYLLASIYGFVVLFGGLIILRVTVLSHRVAGPAYRIQNVLRQIREGDLDVSVNLRKGDFNTEIAEELDLLIAWLREHPPQGIDDVRDQFAEVEAQRLQSEATFIEMATACEEEAPDEVQEPDDTADAESRETDSVDLHEAHDSVNLEAASDCGHLDDVPACEDSQRALDSTSLDDAPAAEIPEPGTDCVHLDDSPGDEHLDDASDPGYPEEALAPGGLQVALEFGGDQAAFDPAVGSSGFETADRSDVALHAVPAPVDIADVDGLSTPDEIGANRVSNAPGDIHELHGVADLGEGDVLIDFDEFDCEAAAGSDGAAKV